jgi:hypothetical protein
MCKDFKQRYNAKAKDSFKTKLNLYLFKKTLEDSWHQFSQNDFVQFEIDDELVRKYTAVYWQYEIDYPITETKTILAVQEEITSKQKEHAELIVALKRDYVENFFPGVYPTAKFQELIASEKCEYCDITIPEIEALADKEMLFKKNLRGWSLEIDRKNSNHEYRPDNCIMACYWCNNAKTDEFTHEEFIEIGKAIKVVWEKRLKA